MMHGTYKVNLKYNLNIQTSKSYELTPFGPGYRPVSSSGRFGGNHSDIAIAGSNCLTAPSTIGFAEIYQLC